MWKKYLSIWVILFGVLGYMLSLVFAGPEWVETEPVVYQWILLFKSMFFMSLKMLIMPLVFVSLVGGLMKVAEVTELGKMGKVTLIYYMSTTAIAILIGLFVVFFVHPWKNTDAIASANVSTIKSQASTPKEVVQEKEATVPAVLNKIVTRVLVNPVDAFSKNNILGIVFWAILIGVAFILIAPKESHFPELVEQANMVLNKILGWVILFSPLGVFSIAFDFQLKFSANILSQLVSFCLVVFAATMFHGLIVLPLIANKLVGVKFNDLFQKISSPFLFAFSTSSSAATLPVSMKTCEEDFKIPKSVSSFVLPLGATMNMDGTALFEGIAAVFLAHFFGIELTTTMILSVFFMAVISSVGAPGMPSGSMSGMQMVLIAAGIPLEGIGILLMVERVLDTFRTAVNVEGDIIGALVVNKYR